MTKAQNDDVVRAVVLLALAAGATRDITSAACRIANNHATFGDPMRVWSWYRDATYRHRNDAELTAMFDACLDTIKRHFDAKTEHTARCHLFAAFLAESPPCMMTPGEIINELRQPQ